MTEPLREGKPAPDFELTTDAGETVRLADLRGKRVVLYFYPRDDTPGCTKQACGIRDSWDAFPFIGSDSCHSRDSKESPAQESPVYP